MIEHPLTDRDWKNGSPRRGDKADRAARGLEFHVISAGTMNDVDRFAIGPILADVVHVDDR